MTTDPPAAPPKPQANDVRWEWMWASWPVATVALAFSPDGRAVLAPPICRWVLGRDHADVARVLRRRGARILWLGPTPPLGG